MEPSTFNLKKNNRFQSLFNPDHGRIIDEYAIVYITKGSGVFYSTITKRVSLIAGDLLFISPGQWHSYYPDSEKGCNQYWVTFHGSYYETLIKQFGLDKNPILHIGLNEHIVRLFNEIITYWNTKGK